MQQLEKWSALDARDIASIAVVWIVTIVLLSRRLFDPSLGYPDADRLLMDGVFIHDFLKDLPLRDIYGYTIEYFGQYPALSIGYRPPFFPLVEALFNLAFGVNVWSSRLGIQAFALVGITAWYLLVRRSYDTSTAFLACLLFVSLPFIAKWGWYTMGELPLVSMAMLTMYLFYRYRETSRPSFLYATAIAYVLTVWTKQTAFYLVFWFMLVMILDRTLIPALKNRHAWGASLLIALGLIPLAAITLWLGDANIAQSVGSSERSSWSVWGTRASNLLRHLQNLLNFQLTSHTAVLAGTGVLWAAFRRDSRLRFFGTFIMVTYLFFSYILNPNERYTIFWLPVFALFAALPAYYLNESKRPAGLVMYIASLLIVALQVHAVYERTPNFATGYDEAARFVVKNSHSPTVFVDAYNNGYFTYFVRQADKDRSMYVLRGDKLLSSSSISASSKLEVHASSTSDIRELFDRYAVQYVVIEDRNYTKLEIHDMLRSYLSDGPFVLERSIPVRSANRPELEGVTLKIFRYLDNKPPKDGILELRLPVVGKTIVVPFRSRKN